MSVIREASAGDLPSVLRLLAQLPLEPDEGYLPAASKAAGIFQRMLDAHGRTVLVAEEGGSLDGVLDLIVVENLTHGGAPWAIVENLVVDSGGRRRGIGKALMEEAVARAQRAGCYKVQLLSNVLRGEAHHFYGALGFKPNAQGFRLYF